jgi:hypothetical protein
MGVTIQQEEGNLRVVRITGLLRKPEMDAALAAEARKWAPTTLLKVLVMLKFWVTFVILLFACLAGSGFSAEKPGTLSRAKEAILPAEQGKAPEDPLGRSTPQGTVFGFIKKASQGDYEQALQYLDTKTGPALTNLSMPCRSFWIGVSPVNRHAEYNPEAIWKILLLPRNGSGRFRPHRGVWRFFSNEFNAAIARPSGFFPPPPWPRFPKFTKRWMSAPYMTIFQSFL